MTNGPAIETGGLRAETRPPALGVDTPIPPPPAVREEKPKLSFENPGAPTGTSAGLARIPIPKQTIDEAVRQSARSAGPIMLGNEDDGGVPLTPGIRPAPIPGKIGSSVELLSDPQGADFIPYLRSVLAAVRRNWYAVIPESARLGRTGRVALQFAIDRSGRVSKLVISTPSGARELDLAAVAGVSASDPFPPLPTEFRGNQVRLQFAFRYNNSGR